MKILVTGGAGFIGSHIVEALLQRGDGVRVLDDFSSGKRENLETLPGKPEIIEGDLRDLQAVRSALNKIDLVFHLAAFVSVPRSMTDPDTCFSVNVAGTRSLLEESRKAGVQKVVLSSSTAIYGDTDIFPTTEDTPPAPLSPYALSKQVNELYAGLHSRVFGLPTVALRYFNVYGPRQRPDSDYAAAIPIFINRLIARQPIIIHGDGKQSRDFIYVKDVVRANLLAAEFEASGKAFNVCTGCETTLLDLVKVLTEISGANPQVSFDPPRAGDIRRSVGNPKKAADQLKFQAEVSLAEGLAETMKWMKGK